MFKQNGSFIIATSFLNDLTRPSKTRILAQLDPTAYHDHTLIVNDRV